MELILFLPEQRVGDGPRVGGASRGLYSVIQDRPEALSGSVTGLAQRTTTNTPLAWPGLGWEGRTEDTAEGGSEAQGGRALPDLPHKGAYQADGWISLAPRQSVARLVVIIRRRSLLLRSGGVSVCSRGVTRCQWGYPP